MSSLKSNSLLRNVAAGLVLIQVSTTIAWAAPTKILPGYIEEVPEAEAERIAPVTPEFWDEYRKAGDGDSVIAPQSQDSLDVGTVIIGVIILDALINLGKKVWQVIEAGRPKVDLKMDVASAVPQGITHWSELEGWKDPVSKLYRMPLLITEKRSAGDLYFRLVFSPGGRYKGRGKYLANVTIVPAQIVVPYRRDFYAKSSVVELLNQGSKKNPVAGMTMLLQWGVRSWLINTEQTISLHVRGDGQVKALPAEEDQAEDIRGTLTHPKLRPDVATDH